MAEWLALAPQGQKMYCHDLEVMGSNTAQGKLGVRSASFEVILEPQI